MESIFILILSLIVAGFSIILLINTANLKALRNLNQYKNISRYPKISVIIPARNEERNIRKCVISLLKQDYPDYEIIVIDDESEDATFEILKELQKDYKRLKIISSKSLPKGWLGKNWACHQGYIQSSGEVLYFTDADTYHSPSTLKQTASAIYTEHVDFLSSIPQQKTITLAEKLIIPPILWLIYTVFPFYLINSKRLIPIYAFAIGQYLVFRREAYEEIGGHEAVKDKIIEDVFLAKNIASAGFKELVPDITDNVNCRMYKGMSEIKSGFSKIFFVMFNYAFPNKLYLSIPMFIVSYVLFSVVFLSPFVMLVLFTISIRSNNDTTSLGITLSLIAIAFLWCSLALVYNRNKTPIKLIFAYPLNFILVIFSSFYSLYLYLSNKLIWKGRNLIDKKEIKEEVLKL